MQNLLEKREQESELYSVLYRGTFRHQIKMHFLSMKVKGFMLTLMFKELEVLSKCQEMLTTFFGSVTIDQMFS